MKICDHAEYKFWKTKISNSYNLTIKKESSYAGEEAFWSI